MLDSWEIASTLLSLGWLFRRWRSMGSNTDIFRPTHRWPTIGEESPGWKSGHGRRFRSFDEVQNLVHLNDISDDGHSDIPIGIVLHGATGEVHHVRTLAQKLNFKVIGVCQTDNVPAGSISSMAMHYLRILERAGWLGSRSDGTSRRRVQLMGYSFGGCIAWEIARLLELEGKTLPERLILLDGGPSSGVSMENTLGYAASLDSKEHAEDLRSKTIRLFGALLLASASRVINPSDIVASLQRFGVVSSAETNDGVVEPPTVESLRTATQETVDCIPASLRGEPLKRLTARFATNLNSYDEYLTFHEAGKVPRYDGPIWIARSKLPRDNVERRRAQLWLDANHYTFLELPELAEAIEALVVV